MELKERLYRLLPMGKTGIKLWVPEDTAISHDGIKEGHMPTQREALDQTLTEKAEIKADHCWSCHERKPIAWVREVQFDVMESAAEIDHASISSADYEGPVPGFCFACIADGPPRLARAVYYDQEQMQWGFRPSRWFCIFTDGTKQGGSCMEIAHDVPETHIEEEHIHGD